MLMLIVMPLLRVVAPVAILEEAFIAFELNSDIFKILRPPTQLDASSLPATPPLGKPLTPQNELDLDDISLQPLSKVIAEAVAPPAAEPTYRIASVIAFIAAISLSHFFLVLGGFMGDKGYGKLEAVQAWFKDTFSASG